MTRHISKSWLKVAVGLGMISIIAAAAPAHVVMSSQQDRQRVMDQLKITLFPSGPGAYLASTYDETTANPYPKLPDPLTFNDGSKVKNASQWNRRRAEIVEMFDREVNDAWVDAKGTFLAGVGAGSVYRLLGKKDLGTDEFPKIEIALVSGDIAFRQHSAGHTPTPNWPVFLEFAARYFDK